MRNLFNVQKCNLSFSEALRISATEKIIPYAQRIVRRQDVVLRRGVKETIFNRMAHIHCNRHPSIF